MGIIPSPQYLQPARPETVDGSFLGSDTDGTDQTTFTFASKTLGAAQSDRVIVVGVTGIGTTGAARSISSVTIGGVTATEIHTETNSHQVVAQYAAVVPTGTTGDIVVTWNTTMNQVGVGWWRLPGADIASVAAAGDENGAADTTQTASVNVAAGSFVIANSYNVNSSAATASYDTLDEDYDSNVDGTHYHAAASRLIETADASRQTECTVTASSGGGGMVLASYPHT